MENMAIRHNGARVLAGREAAALAKFRTLDADEQAELLAMMERMVWDMRNGTPIHKQAFPVAMATVLYAKEA